MLKIGLDLLRMLKLTVKVMCVEMMCIERSLTRITRRRRDISSRNVTFHAFLQIYYLYFTQATR